MPELPEVEAVSRRLREQVTGAEIRRARVLRPRSTYPQPPSKVEHLAAGRTIEAVQRRGKHILIYLSGGIVLGCHLRMTGNLHVVPDAGTRPASTRLYLELADGRGIVLNDPRALGVMNAFPLAQAETLMNKLGIEPLSAEFTPDRLIEFAARSKMPVKVFLMDQRFISGLGNIYAAEALYRARIHPATPASQIRPARLRRLHAAIVDVLNDAVKSAYIAYERPGQFREAERFPLAVYGREGVCCSVCHRKIRRLTQAGRSTYYCPGCQR